MRKRRRKIIGATYILLDELCIHQAGSRDHLISIKVDQVVAGLCREKTEEAGLPRHRLREQSYCSWQLLGPLSFPPTSLAQYPKFYPWNFTFWGDGKCWFHTEICRVLGFHRRSLELLRRTCFTTGVPPEILF